MPEQILLCVPGPWADAVELGRAIASTAFGYELAGGLLVKTETRQAFPTQLQGPDPKLVGLFQSGGQGRMPKEALDEIGAHRTVLYVLCDGRSPEHAKAMLDVGRALVAAGGLGVKVETSGKALSAAAWERCAPGGPGDLYWAFVVLVGQVQGMHISCGMHHFNLPDVAVPGDVHQYEAADLMDRFNLYRMTQNPPLRSGATFSLNDDAPKYLLRLVESAFPANDPFHNPHGEWHLAHA
ncbi:MAG: hypothetical protein ACAI43_07665 [Phycisphaerae bacterium]|nr:hypothetical protein [Tepidisphaeraceae bacterium]